MTNDRLCAVVAAEAEVEIMTVERNGTDLVFTPSSLSSAGMSDGQNRQIRQGGGRMGGRNKRKTNRDIKNCIKWNKCNKKSETWGHK